MQTLTFVTFDTLYCVVLVDIFKRTSLRIFLTTSEDGKAPTVHKNSDARALNKKWIKPKLFF